MTDPETIRDLWEADLEQEDLPARIDDGPGEARLAAMVRQASIPVLETPLNNQLSLMLQSGFAGFALVFLVLALFLELRLAFWVSLGIPISFLGANRAAAEPRLSPSTCCRCFVLVLGIVVDDAIIVGENIYRHQEEHGDGMRGSIEGAYEIAKPVTFAVLTTVAAFSPLLFVPGETVPYCPIPSVRSDDPLSVPSAKRGARGDRAAPAVSWPERGRRSATGRQFGAHPDLDVRSLGGRTFGSRPPARRVGGPARPASRSRRGAIVVLQHAGRRTAWDGCR